MASHVKAREKSDGDSAASISAKKNGSAAFAFAFAGSVASISRQSEGHRFSFFVRPLPLSSFSSRDGPMDERGLSFRTIVRLQNSH